MKGQKAGILGQNFKETRDLSPEFQKAEEEKLNGVFFNANIIAGSA
jgi:hypothetical protein